MYLITGATGTIGQLLVEALRAADAELKAVTRDPSNAAFPAGVEAIAPEAIRSALKGVDGLFVHPRASKDNIDELLKLAADAGIRKVVVMSAINVDDELDHQPSRYNGDRNAEMDRAVTTSGIPWVSVRPSSFAMNTLNMWRGQIAAGDIVRGPFGSFAEAVIHERDVAEVIAKALLDDSLLGRTLPITGPVALRLDEMVPLIGTAIGRPLRFQEVPAELAAQGMIRSGLDEQFVRALMARYQRELIRPATVTTELESILGHPARTFATWAADHAGAWS